MILITVFFKNLFPLKKCTYFYSFFSGLIFVITSIYYERIMFLFVCVETECVTSLGTAEILYALQGENEKTFGCEKCRGHYWKCNICHKYGHKRLSAKLLLGPNSPQPIHY